VQAADIRFLRKVQGVTLRDKVRSCEIHEVLNVEPFFRIKKFQLRWLGYVPIISHERLARQAPLATHWESGPEVVERGGVIKSPNVVGPVSMCGASRTICSA